MSGTFRQAYAALLDFVAKHPEIEIGESVTGIPENVRPGFYAAFNAARRAFIEEAFPECLSGAGRLRQEYCKAAQAASPWLSFEDGPVASKCARFLNDPQESLARELFDPLFDLLKQRETPVTFKQRASNDIEALFPIVHRGGYEKWAVLSLANLLEVQQAYRVPVRELQPGDRAKSSTYAPMEEVPAPVESTCFCFSPSPKAIFAAPDFIIRSGTLKRFIGFRSEFREALFLALNASMDREWSPVDAGLLQLLENGLTLIYASERPEGVALVADVAKFCRPDLILWCVDTRTMTRKAALERMAPVAGRINPSKGIFIIANEPWLESEDADATRERNAPAGDESSHIRILTAGFDPAGLMPVVQALSEEQ